MLAMMIIARLYLELRLPHASKSYALAVSYIAAASREEELADLVPAGLLTAASADFIAGAWCGAAELYELGLAAQLEFIEDSTDSERHTAVDNAFLHLTYVNACARIVDCHLGALVGATTDRTGALEIIEDAVDALSSKDRDYWESFGGTELVGRPFSDLGNVRYILFSALGTDWTLTTVNDIDSVRLAERFAAAAQVMLAALTQDDLCLVQTQINIRIENRKSSDGEPIQSLPSNDGREWVVRLAPVGTSDDADFEDTNTELLTILMIILREASLLPEADFSASLERAFERGLGHKLTPGRPYDQLAAAFASNAESEIPRSLYNAPWDCRDRLFRGHDELRWQDGPGPTYSRKQAQEMLQTRYVTLAKSLQITDEMLAFSEEFRSTVDALRTRGWLDWHILAAIANIVMNYRFPSDRLNLLSAATQREMMQAMSSPESATAEPVPIGLFTADAMNDNRQFAMMSLLKHWGLECQQRTPDIPAIERLLADRYGYWDDDVPHDDPFPDPGKRGPIGGLLVIKDVFPPEHQA